MKITPQTFLIADTHFGHNKMVDIWGKRKASHNEDMVEAWNSVVGKHDVVLHLGDLTMTGKEETLKYTSRLRGKKYLIRGNHDEASDTWFSDVGFTTIPAAFQVFKDKYDKYQSVLFTHVPVADMPTNWFNIHGHLHGDAHRMKLKDARYFDVGADPLDFVPIKLYEVLKLLPHNTVEKEKSV